LDALIRAVSKIENSYLLLSSIGPEENYLRKIGHDLLGDNIKFLGMVDRSILAGCYAVCDVFCLPSEKEPFGLVLIEAMASGIPVVTNNSEIQKWIVDGGGSCIDVTNMEILVKSLEQYKDKNLSEKTGQQGRKNVLERFSWDRAAEKYFQLFKELAQK
jgi:glycosyltransferase involved in cell wall biosynthesis